MKFEQIVTYYGSIPNGVLNFRVKDISYFHKPKDTEFASLLMKGSRVYYSVKHEDLKAILDTYSK